MKKQLQKIKLGVENFSRPSKPDKNSEELQTADAQVERFKDVLEKIVKKFTPNAGGLSGIGGSSGYSELPLDAASREKRCKKVHEHRLAQAMEESLLALPEGLLRDVLENCAKLEKNIANKIVDNESKVEADVSRKLSDIMDKHLSTIQKQKRIVNKLMQDKESAKYKHQAAIRVSENSAKISQLREEQEECENKLEKERDIWAAEMFELIAEEETVAKYIVNYVEAQQLYYRSALDQIDTVVSHVNGLIKGNNKRTYRVPLEEHLAATNRTIAYVIEMCVCCLLEKGMNEEGLLRVGCAGSKLRRFRSAIDANFIQTPFTAEYQDVHVIAGVLKSYLRDLPDPLLTFALYQEFVEATSQVTEDERKRAILNAVNQLPDGNYSNLRYLTKFLTELSARSGQNKMSTQNIAIVMSPNLLWPPDSNESDYMQKVNSSTAVNKIVELLVSDWSYFFEGDVEFYVTLNRDSLFPDSNGGSVGFEVDSMPASMTKSMNVAWLSNDISANSEPHSLKTHSRSNSNDTSLILLDNTKRSQSSSSLSDGSSPPQNSSPKPNLRRKHHKQAAPTPPDLKLERNERFRSESDDTKREKPMPAARNLVESTESMTNKPDKPPRPVLVSTECQTLNRSQYRSAKESSTSGGHSRPSALPRQMLFTNRSTENLSDKTPTDEQDPVQLREPTSLKPAIPERPVSLMRTIPKTGSNPETNPHQFNEHIKKTHSFRGPSSNNGAVKPMNGGGGSMTTLERTHIYNVDKKQVAIIDFVDTNKSSNPTPDTVEPTATKSTNEAPPIPPPPSIVTATMRITPTSSNAVSSAQVSTSTTTTAKHPSSIELPTTATDSSLPSPVAASLTNVPPSPRGFDPKIKRPQIPAPPPPTSVSRTKSESGDSTNL